MQRPDGFGCRQSCSPGPGYPEFASGRAGFQSDRRFVAGSWAVRPRRSRGRAGDCPALVELDGVRFLQLGHEPENGCGQGLEPEIPEHRFFGKRRRKISPGIRATPRVRPVIGVRSLRGGRPSPTGQRWNSDPVQSDRPLGSSRRAVRRRLGGANQTSLLGPDGVSRSVHDSRPTVAPFLVAICARAVRVGRIRAGRYRNAANGSRAWRLPPGPPENCSGAAWSSCHNRFHGRASANCRGRNRQ